MGGSHSAIPVLPKAGEEIDAWEFAARMAGITAVPEGLAQKIARGLDAMDGELNGLIAVDRYSDERAGRIDSMISSQLQKHGIPYTAPFLSISHFTNVLVNDTRDPSGLINREQLESQIAVNLGKLGFMADESLSRALAETVQSLQGRSDGLISTFSGKRGYGRGNATVGQLESMMRSEYPALPASPIAVAIASALNPVEEFIPSSEIPSAPSRGDQPMDYGVELPFLAGEPNMTRASMANPESFFFPELIAINYDVASLVRATRDPVLISELRKVLLPLEGSEGISTTARASLAELRLSPELEAEIREMRAALASLRERIGARESVAQDEVTKLRMITDRLSAIRPALSQAVLRWRPSAPPPSMMTAAASAAEVLETEASEVGQFSNRFGPYGKPLMIGAAVLLVIGGVVYYCSRNGDQGNESPSREMKQ